MDGDGSATPSGCPLGLLIGAHLALVALMLGGAFDPFFNDAMHRAGPGTDFRVFYGAAQAWWHGGSVYDEAAAFGYRYHPAFAILLAATLGQLPFDAAFYAWAGLAEIALLSMLPGVRRMFPAGSSQRDAATALLLFFSPFLLDVYMGQASFLAGALLWHAWHALAAGRRGPGALWFALAILVKPVGLALAPVLVARREWRVLGGGLAFTGGLAGVCFAVDPAGFAVFLERNFAPVPHAGWVVHAGNQGLHALLATAFARGHGLPIGELTGFAAFPAYARWILGALPIALVVLSAYLTWRLRAAPGACLALWSAAFLLGYKDVWEHSYAFFLPGLLLLLSADVGPRGMLLACGIGLALPTGFVFYDAALPPGPFDPERVWPAGTSLLHHATKPLWVAIVYGMCVRRALRDAAAP